MIINHILSSFKIQIMNNQVLSSPVPVSSSTERTVYVPHVDYYSSKKAAMIFRAINHKLRQHIIEIIHESKRCTVTELYIKLRIDQSVASQHLGVLRRVGVVTTERDGKFVYYKVNDSRLAAIDRFIKDLLA